MMKKIAKAVGGVIASHLLLLCSVMSAMAIDPDCMIKIDERGNFIAEGGINYYMGEKAITREETVSLENKLRDSNYILITSDAKEITDEEYEQFNSYPFWFTKYMKRENEWYWSRYKVYVYYPSYRDYMEQYNEYGGIEDYTRLEIETSSVLISYALCESIELAGTLDDEYGDNIPDYRETGYLRIESPIDMKLTLNYPVTNRYYEFLVEANKPYVVKMKTGVYNVVGINTYAFKDWESTIPNTNVLNIEAEYDKENPLIISLQKCVETYGIESINLDDADNVVISEIPEVKVEQVTVDEEEQAPKKKKGSLLLPVICGIMVIIAAVGALYKKKKEKHND